MMNIRRKIVLVLQKKNVSENEKKNNQFIKQQKWISVFFYLYVKKWNKMRTWMCVSINLVKTDAAEK